MKRGILAVGLFVVAAIIGAMVVRMDFAAHDILISEAKASLTESGSNAVGIFLKIDNTGGPDRLLAASSGDAGGAVLYSPESENGLPIPANSNPSLAPDGAHVVLSDIQGDLIDGRLIPVKLTFERAGTITTKARYTGPVSAERATHAGLFGFGDICVAGEGEPAPEVSLSVARTPDKPGWRVTINAKDFEFDRDLMDGQHVPGTGHGHLYVGGVKIGRLFEPVVDIGALPKGRHEIRVTLNTNDHRAYVVDDVPVTATATIEAD